MDYKNKYLKYKQKYLALKEQSGFAQGGSIKQKYLALKDASAQGDSIKQKYLALKEQSGFAQGNRNLKINQIGGVKITSYPVPAVLQALNSWLFMPLIYQSLTDISIVYSNSAAGVPFPMETRFLNARFEYNQIFQPNYNASYDEFNAAIRARLAGFGITRRAQLIPPFAAPAVNPRFYEDLLARGIQCHISKAAQEEILFSELGGVAPTLFYTFLEQSVRENHPGNDIIYNTNP